MSIAPEAEYSAATMFHGWSGWSSIHCHRCRSQSAYEARKFKSKLDLNFPKEMLDYLTFPFRSVVQTGHTKLNGQSKCAKRVRMDSDSET